MTKIRSIPFGYQIVNGVIVVNENEAKTIRRIFEMYISGCSLGDIARTLTDEMVRYSDATLDWNKSRVSRILSNSMYKGSDKLNGIVPSNVFDEVNELKMSKYCPKSVDIGYRLLCSNCETKLLTRFPYKKQVLYCKCCGEYINVSCAEISKRIGHLIDYLTCNIVLLIPRNCITVGVLKPDIKLYELKRALTHIDFSQDEVLQLISEIAKIEYNASDVGSDILAKRLRNRIERASCNGKVSVEFVQEYIDKVCVDKCGNIILYMTTGVQISERSVIDGGHKNTEENGEPA